MLLGSEGNNLQYWAAPSLAEIDLGQAKEKTENKTAMNP